MTYITEVIAGDKFTMPGHATVFEVAETKTRQGVVTITCTDGTTFWRFPRHIINKV